MRGKAFVITLPASHLPDSPAFGPNPQNDMSTDKPLRDQVALVTGASAGIGRATAHALAAAGAHVVVTARRGDRLEALVQQIQDVGGQALGLAADAASLDQVRAVVDQTIAQLGRIDILVNNAGIMRISPITENRVEDWAAMVDVNVKGVLYFLSATMPHMIDQNSGHIVSVGSVAGRRPFPGASVYSATKFAVRSLS
jgi:NADP-dependent 3-hydroxy acid dehydrogenase YdfG